MQKQILHAHPHIHMSHKVNKVTHNRSNLGDTIIYGQPHTVNKTTGMCSHTGTRSSAHGQSQRHTHQRNIKSHPHTHCAPQSHKVTTTPRGPHLATAPLARASAKFLTFQTYQECPFRLPGMFLRSLVGPWVPRPLAAHFPCPGGRGSRRQTKLPPRPRGGLWEM